MVSVDGGADKEMEDIGDASSPAAPIVGSAGSSSETSSAKRRAIEDGGVPSEMDVGEGAGASGADGSSSSSGGGGDSSGSRSSRSSSSNSSSSSSSVGLVGVVASGGAQSPEASSSLTPAEASDTTPADADATSHGVSVGEIPGRSSILFYFSKRPAT